MSKTRKKQYNPLKATIAELQLLTRTIVLTSRLDVSKGKVRLWRTHTKKPFIPTQNQYNILNKNKFKWSLILVVWSNENNGKERTNAVLAKSPIYAFHDELIPQLNELHQSIIAKEKAKGNLVHNAGWIALPYDFGNLSSEQEDQLIDTYLPFLDYK